MSVAIHHKYNVSHMKQTSLYMYVRPNSYGNF